MRLFSELRNLRNKIYSRYCRSQFGSCGERPRIYYPLALRNAKDVFIGNHVEIRSFCQISLHKRYSFQGGIKEFAPAIKIGNNCDFGMYNTINCCNKISIGDNFLSGKNVTINDSSHGVFDKLQLTIAPKQRPLYSKGEITIGQNVWIGDNVVILGGVTIGEGAIIAANAVVISDIPAYSLAAGVPARVKKTLQL